MQSLNSYKARGIKKNKFLDILPLPKKILPTITFNISVATVAELLKIILYIVIIGSLVTTSLAIYNYYVFKQQERTSFEEHVEERLVPIIARQQALEEIYDLIKSNYVYVPYARGDRRVINAIIMNGPNKGKKTQVKKY